MLFFFFSETREWKQSAEAERARGEKLPARPCHRLMHVWFDVLWETSAGGVTMAMSCSHPSRGWGPWIINDTRPHREQYESPSPHRRNKMFPLSIHPFAHRCRLHSRLLTIASNYPHCFFLFFFFLFFPLPLMKSSQSLVSAVCLCCRGGEAEVAIERKIDSMCLSEWRWRVSVWLVNPV